MLPSASSVPPAHGIRAETTHDTLQVTNMELRLCPAAGQPSGRGAQAAPCLMQSSSNANRPHPHQCGQSCCLLCHLREINTSDRGASARKQGSQEHLLGSSKIIPAYWKKNRSSLQTPPSCLRCWRGESPDGCSWCLDVAFPLTIGGSPVAVGPAAAPGVRGWSQPVPAHSQCSVMRGHVRGAEQRQCQSIG